MLSENQIKEIREIIEKSDNPLYFFDCDTDGLTSFILIYRKYQKGKGVVVKGTPYLDINYLRKVEEYNPDLIVVLDKPQISQDFLDKVHMPILWIDHHPPVEVKGRIKYYNPRLQNPTIYLTTAYLIYQVIKQDLWIAALGVIGDYAIPDFIEEFRKQYPDLIGEEKEPGRIIYETEFGKIIRMYNFLLKGKTSEVNKSISILTKIDDPYELIKKETPRAKYVWKRAEKIEREYKELLNQAERWAKDELLVFVYPDKKLSLSGDLSVELSYRHPDKVIVVGREKSGEIKLSLRSKRKRIDEPLKKALIGIQGYGGGHEFACGGNVKKEDFPKFIEQLRKAIREQPLHQR